MADENKTPSGERPGVWLPVGEAKKVGRPLWRPGWAWGSTSGGEWLTILGSAYTTPKLGKTPASAYTFDGMDPRPGEVCALVAPVFHGGVTLTQTGFYILQRAEWRDLGIANVLAFEDLEEDAGQLEPDDRTTCHTCQVWATDEHVAGDEHRRALMAAAMRELMAERVAPAT